MFVTYKASAGSGKTTHLVAEYLSICFSENGSFSYPEKKFRNIMAITFTNNATAEMKQRIMETLYEFAFREDYSELPGSCRAIWEMIKKNLGIFGKEADLSIRKKSLILLKEIVYDYPSFSISTIDSFFQRLIRAFALELHINLNFNLEIELDEFFDQTVDLLLNQVSKAEQRQAFSVSEQVLNLMENNLAETGKSNLERDLRKILFFIYDEDSYLPLKKLENTNSGQIKLSARKLLEERKELKKKIRALASEGETLIRENALQPEQFYYGTKGPYVWYTKVSGNPDKIASKYVSDALEKGCLTKKEGIIPDVLHQKLIEIARRIFELSDSYRLKAILCQNLDSFLLLFDLKQIMDEIKLHDNLFYLSETNSKIYDTIRDEEVPYIYEKLGNRYSYFLIDEFQDTSKMQWKDLLPLIKNALSGANFYGEIGKTILFGDVKQAIYRFRNGDSSLLNQLSSEEGYMAEMGKTADPGEFSTVTLATNYRSSKAIVTFNNWLFRFFEKLNDKEKPVFALANEYYRDVEQEIPDHTDRSGFVSILFRDDNAGENYMIEEVVRAVKEALGRNFQYRDIAVLTKDRKSGSEYGKILAEHHIPVISTDSLLLSSSEKIRVLIATLQYLTDPRDELAKLVMARFIHRDENYGLPPTVISILKDEEKFTAYLQSAGINIEREKLLALPLFTLIKELIVLYQLTESDIFIISFLDVVLDYMNGKNPEIVRFLDWWDKQAGKLSISSPQNLDAVTVTTVHKAKGLQYPVVIFPLTQYSHAFTKKKFWYYDENNETGIPCFPVNINANLKETVFEEEYNCESELSKLDNLNLLYVAHTRASECFYIITGKRTDNKGNYAKYLSRFVDEELTMIVEDPENEYRYWHGNKEYIHERKKVNSHETHTIPTLPVSSFTPCSEQLVYHDVKEKTFDQERGIRIHHILSSLRDFPQNQDEIDNLQLVGEETMIQTIKNFLGKIIADDQLKPYFTKEASIFNEVNIADKDGKVYRPDRIAIRDNEVLVVDYKTGKEKPSHHNQIEKYAELLQHMGFEKVSCKVVYI